LPAQPERGRAASVEVHRFGAVQSQHQRRKFRVVHTDGQPFLAAIDGLIYMCDDNGVASCLEAATGEVVWQKRIGGKHSASPIHAEGRIYFFSHEGETTVIEAAREYKESAKNQLEEGFMASPAVVGKALILRTETDLYRIEK